MSDVTMSEASARFADLLRRVRGSRERVRIMEEGSPVAVVISPEDLELLEELEALEDAADGEAFDRAKAADDGERIPWSDVKAELGL